MLVTVGYTEGKLSNKTFPVSHWSVLYGAIILQTAILHLQYAAASLYALWGS